MSETRTVWNWDRPKQQHLGRGAADGIPGDCWRCCIAAVLQVPVAEVPHWLHEKPDGYLEPDTQDWLNARGYVLVAATEIPVWSDSHRECKAPFPPVICCGPTRRSEKMGQHHAVVMDERSGELLYDPHPDNCGLTAVMKRWRIFKLP